MNRIKYELTQLILNNSSPHKVNVAPHSFNQKIVLRRELRGWGILDLSNSGCNFKNALLKKCKPIVYGEKIGHQVEHDLAPLLMHYTKKIYIFSPAFYYKNKRYYIYLKLKS